MSSPVLVSSQIISNPEIVILGELAEKLTGYQKQSPCFPQNADGADIKAHSVTSEVLMQAIRDSVLHLRSIVDFAHKVNALGRTSEDRPLAVGQEILPVVIKGIIGRLYRQEDAAKDPAQRSEIHADMKDYNLYKRFSEIHGDDFATPTWFATLSAFCHITNRLNDLPSPINYLSFSELARASGSHERLELRVNRNLELIGSLIAKGENASGAMAIQEQIDQEIEGVLSTNKDVDPLKMPVCMNKISLEVAVNLDIANSILSLYQGLGLTIKALVADINSDVKIPVIEITELLQERTHDTDEERPHQLIPTKIAHTVLSSDDILKSKEAILPELLELYLGLRQTLSSISADYTKQHSKDPDYKFIRNQIENTQKQVFPGLETSSTEVIRKILFILRNTSTSQSSRLQAELLTTKVPIIGQNSPKIFIDQPSNVDLYERVVDLMLHSDTETTALLVSELRGSSLRSTTDICLKSKELLQRKDYDRLSWLFDNEIESFLTDKSKTEVQGTGLLLSLLATSEDLQVRQALRGRIKRMEDLPKVFDKLFQGIQEGSPNGMLLQSLRIRITQRFEDNLSNYWGQRQVVEEVCNDIEEHLLLLKHPAASAGISTKKVFKNGHVFYGPPGAGKTYLAVCVANHYGLPYLKISREEMASIQTKTKEEDQTSLEDTISVFLEEQAQKALKLKKMSGAPAVILMIDEMEAEFFKRNPDSSTRAEFLSTNIMLRVIEKLMAKYPEIIFFAATNHMELVDSAATRVGRYGFGKYIGAPDKESIQAIIHGNLTALGYKIGLEELVQDNRLETLVAESQGLMPEPISLAITNRVCLERARALDRGEDFASSSEIPFEELIEAMKLIKRQTKFHRDLQSQKVQDPE